MAPDKAKILAQRKQTIDDPQKFAGLTFHPGVILLVGELVRSGVTRSSELRWPRSHEDE